MEKALDLVKRYARIDYEDDDDLVQVMIEAAAQTMGELVPGFEPEKMTARQKIILAASVKSVYDDREKYAKDAEQMKAAVASMLLSEIYERKAGAANG